MDTFTHLHALPARQTQRGLSLIELMISVAIGLVILSTLITLFLNQSKARVELDKANRMIDNGTYAMDLLSSNLRVAGFYDNFSPSGTPTVVYSPCDTASLTDATLNPDILNMAVQGYDAATATSQIASPPCGLTYATGTDHALKAGSDILVVRRASTAPPTSATNPVNGTIYLQVSMCPTDAAAPPNNYQIASAPAVAPVSFASIHTKDCATPAGLRPFIVETYFVAPYDVVGDGIPTLKQIDQYGNVTPLVEGIEYMQVDYGVDGDTDGDGIPDLTVFDGMADSYSTTCSGCTTPAQWASYWSNVVSVRVNLVARNQDPTTGWNDTKTYSLGKAGTLSARNDAYKRHAYTQLIRLVNPAGRREQ